MLRHDMAWVSCCAKRKWQIFEALLLLTHSTATSAHCTQCFTCDVPVGQGSRHPQLLRHSFCFASAPLLSKPSRQLPLSHQLFPTMTAYVVASVTAFWLCRLYCRSHDPITGYRDKIAHVGKRFQLVVRTPFEAPRHQRLSHPRSSWLTLLLQSTASASAAAGRRTVASALPLASSPTARLLPAVAAVRLNSCRTCSSSSSPPRRQREAAIRSPDRRRRRHSSFVSCSNRRHHAVPAAIKLSACHMRMM